MASDISVNEDKEQPLPAVETNDNETSAIQEDLLTIANEDTLDEPKTSTASSETTLTNTVVSDGLVAKSDETPNCIKPIPVTSNSLPSLSLAEQEKHTITGSYVILYNLIGSFKYIM